jgi:hypothetical protein
MSASLKAGVTIIDPIDLGPVAKWGHPVSRDNISQWPDYYLGPWARMERLPTIVFVDGRFRVNCVLASAIYCKPGTHILVHDYNSRAQYHLVEEYIAKITTVDDMALFRVSESVDYRAILSCLSQRLYNAA